MTEPDLTEAQKAYNVAQYEMFQLAAYGHCTYTNGEMLTDEGRRQQRDYNDRIRTAREELEAAVLRLVAERGEMYRTVPAPVVGWLRTLADDPAELSLLVLSPEELEEVRPAAPAAVPVSSPPADRAETDEQRADREETERDHARGDHTHCGIGCEVELPTEHLRNFVVAKGYPGTKGALDELLRRARAEAAMSPPADRAAELSDRERAMLSFALEMAQEEIYARSLEFTDDDKAALKSLRRLADETPAAAPDRAALKRLLLERLESGRARALASAGHAEPEVALRAKWMASGYLHAAADVVRVFEGPEAAQAYVARAVGGEEQPARCDVKFEGGGQCVKPAGHRPSGSQDPHVPSTVDGTQQDEVTDRG
ncbi:hypothetical protein [Streptomyces hirsutus]|uniref:hypothetical protein n=1 Tax=Streptomyces hirsutus TaxID=35620 RepID=UPI0036AF06FB